LPLHRILRTDELREIIIDKNPPPMFFVGRADRTSMYSLGAGESGARARLAFRILGQSAGEFVATSMGQFAHESRFTNHITT
jgi:hypothetical protein